MGAKKGSTLFEHLKLAFTLLDDPKPKWLIGAVLGSVGVAALDMLGVAAMLPLMQLVMGSPTDEGAIKIFAELFGTEDRATLIAWVALFIGAAFVAKTVFVICFRWWLLGRSNNLEVQAGTELLRRYLAAPYWAHRRRNFGVINRGLATGISQTFTQVVSSILSVLVDCLTVLAILSVLIVISPIATLITVITFFFITFGVQFSLKRHHRKIGETLAEADINSWMAFMPAIQGFRETRFSNSMRLWLNRYRKAKRERAYAMRKLSIISELPKYILEIGLIVVIGGLAIVLFTVSPQNAIEVIGVFAAAATRLMPSLNRMSASIASIRAGRVGVDILVTEIRQLDEHGEIRLPASEGRKFSGDIVVRDVTFAFSDADSPVLENVNTTIKSGETVAFVGSSGAGKSTLLDLILGLLQPTEGTIEVGGRPIESDLVGWFDSFGVVPQDVFLIDETLKTNIAFGVQQEDISNERLKRAIKLAQLDEVVKSLPDGLETKLGERGSRLSGGQRQRVGIARALYLDPAYLIMDEATSALDNETEHRITETIASLRGSMTIILVAHRLSTVKDADRVIFFSGGKIRSEGTFDEVRRDNAEFAHLVSLGKLV